ncbi:uncharacterized protein G2W53_002127 [Senna tora]|uniref:Uncharacterized protein n=1 Tax=Senna tora TaxID=362788 RepID=A0A835CN66_9FABA|nr:uncharacterized protein G2W53_002127 [Senna tora]
MEGPIGSETRGSESEVEVFLLALHSKTTMLSVLSMDVLSSHTEELSFWNGEKVAVEGFKFELNGE